MDVAFVDLEGTGPDPYVDRVWEVCVWAFDGLDDPAKGLGTDWDPDPDHRLVEVVRPPKPVPDEVLELTGADPAEIEAAPPFDAVAADVQDLVAGRALVGYSLRGYDTVLLHRELRLAGEDGIDAETLVEVDPYRVWREMEPRDLETAARRFGAPGHGDLVAEEGHRAEADVRVLVGICRGMAREFGLWHHDDAETLRRLAEASRPEWEVDRAGKFRRRDDGVVEFNFGKHRGVPVADHPGYLEWMVKADFPPGTTRWARRLLDDAE